jgi:hypothetical protein
MVSWWCISPRRLVRELPDRIGERRAQKSLSDVKLLTLFRQRMVLMSRQGQSCCFSHEGGRIRSSSASRQL